MDGRDARIAAKRARKQEEAEMASAYERLKQELADHRGVASPSDPGDAPESEEEEEEEQSNLQLDLLDDFCRGPGPGSLPRDVYAMAFNGLRVRVMIGDLSDAEATAIAVGRIKVLAREGFGPGDKEGVCRDIWARLQSLESELRATLDDSVAGEG